MLSYNITFRSKRSLPSLPGPTSSPCEKRVDLSAFGRLRRLCLRRRRFADVPCLREYHDEMNVTVYGSGGEKTALPLASLGLDYVVGHVEGEPFSAADGIVLRRDGRFYGSVYVDDGVLFVDPGRGAPGSGGNQTFTRFNDPLESGVDPPRRKGAEGGDLLAGEEFRRVQREMRALLRPALNALVSK